MFNSYKIKQWVSLSILRVHVCTLAMTMTYNFWWRIPRDAFRYGGLAYGLAHSVALLTVAMPIALLQLAVGQLSQQDATGIWRAVPFFKGVGYLRLLITSIGSIYTSVYLSLTTTNFFYTISNPYPTWECTELIIPEDVYETSVFNSSLLCYNETFIAPVAEQPENYLAIALIISALWVVFPFMLFNPIKFMKRTFYVLAPLVLVLAIVIVSAIGDWNDLLFIQKRNDWPNFLDPDIWYAAFIQALWSSQIAGGYLISSGDNVYSNTSVQWTTVIVIALCIVMNWTSLIFWFAIGGSGEKDTTAVAVIFQTYNLASEKQLEKAWPLVIFATLFFSGIITMITLLMPLYDRLRRVGGPKWRVWTAASSLVGGGAALAVLAGRLPALHALEDVATPLLISVATILEISAFIFIYGWKVLLEDVEFLTEHAMSKYWVMGWCAAPGIIAPFSIWWIIMMVVQDSDWSKDPWDTVALVIAFGLAVIIFVAGAAIAVARQVQYDFIGKLKSSFKPSRHWGPRDPITHYYWLARREEVDRRNVTHTRYRRNLGQLSGRSSFLRPFEFESQHQPTTDVKRRTNSDDVVYTTQRRHHLQTLSDSTADHKKRRSKSLDFDTTAKNTSTFALDLISGIARESHFSDSAKENNNNDSIKKY